MIYQIKTCRPENTWQGSYRVDNFFESCMWLVIDNLPYHVLLNRNASVPKPAVNITVETRWRNRLMWEKSSPQIITNKGLSIDPIDHIMLKLTIHEQLLNSYCTRFEIVTIYQLRNLQNCEWWSIKKWKWLQTVIQ